MTALLAIVGVRTIGTGHGAALAIVVRTLASRFADDRILANVLAENDAAPVLVLAATLELTGICVTARLRRRRHTFSDDAGAFLLDATLGGLLTELDSSQRQVG